MSWKLFRTGLICVMLSGWSGAAMATDDKADAKATAEQRADLHRRAVGEWEMRYQSPQDDVYCKTMRFLIQRSPEELAAYGELQLVEETRCREYTARLNYFGRVDDLGGRHLLSFYSPPEDSKIQAVEAPAAPAGNEYYPDRLTLWLSPDACTLVGYRKDPRSTVLVHEFRKQDCTPATQ